ncbi:MAG TPA: hypothetical protein VFG59_20425 [Anaeromyxobacter sp.]|nr:hypothetical protein [Anaeromyxobacter sp.]
MKGLAAAWVLAGVPALAADTNAQAKDRAHENEIHARMKAREKKPTAKNLQGKASRTADQGADAARAGGARLARTYHGVVHSGKKGVNHLSKKTANATK